VFGVSPNETELAALFAALGGDARTSSVEEQCQLLFRFGVRIALVKLGKEGAMVVEAGAKHVRRFAAPHCERICSVSGAGDCLLAAFLFGRVTGLSLDAGWFVYVISSSTVHLLLIAMDLAMDTVRRCLETDATVPHLAVK
jgi:sugar/nucleoside kinase (ribokinase family)